MSFEIKKFDEARQAAIDAMRNDLIQVINPAMNFIASFIDSRERSNAINRMEEAISWLDKCIVMFEPQQPEAPKEGELLPNPEAPVEAPVAPEAPVQAPDAA